MDVDVCSHSVPVFTVVWIGLCDNSKLYHKVLMDSLLLGELEWIR